MSRVFVSGSTGAAVYVFSDDHCPPHVHARHRAEGWIARLRFSFLGGDIELLSIAPTRNTPLQRTINRLLEDIASELSACRKFLWDIRRTTCLENQVMRQAGGAAMGTRKIAAATYDAALDKVFLTFDDGVTT